MDDADIGHTIMSIKDMIYAGYYLKEDQGIVINSGILSGNMPYINDQIKSDCASVKLPKFRIPKFQPRVLTRVPSIERSKMMFPINLADFIF